jgi:hypothetical protein
MRTSRTLLLAGGLLAMACSRQHAPADGSFDVEITNDCPRAMPARFVVIPPGATREAERRLVEAAPVVELPPRSVVHRRMVRSERLEVLYSGDGRSGQGGENGGSFSGWFDSPEDGRGGVMRIDKACTGIQVGHRS